MVEQPWKGESLPGARPAPPGSTRCGLAPAVRKHRGAQASQIWAIQKRGETTAESDFGRFWSTAVVTGKAEPQGMESQAGAQRDLHGGEGTVRMGKGKSRGPEPEGAKTQSISGMVTTCGVTQEGQGRRDRSPHLQGTLPPQHQWHSCSPDTAMRGQRRSQSASSSQFCLNKYKEYQVQFVM